ncbi:MAG: hypothetical protein NC548_57535, partial [Lachnospiraceae bacterium]|nr:hypothetical protein [Lachnospiraceae bacterium]
MKKCSCNTSKKPAKILSVTQLDAQTVLEPENLANKDNILVLTKNLNGYWNVKLLSSLTMKTVTEAMDNSTSAAFLLIEQKDPPADPAEEPTDPDNPDNPDITEPTDPTDPDNPGSTGTDTGEGDKEDVTDGGDGN